MANPQLRIEATGETRELQFKDDWNDSADDRTAVHEIPYRDGDIEQKVGRGNRKFEGTLVILPKHHPDGIDGFKEFIREAARSDDYVTYIDKDGNEFKGAVREPDFTRNLTSYPAKEELDGFTFVELNQPQP